MNQKKKKSTEQELVVNPKGDQGGGGPRGREGSPDVGGGKTKRWGATHGGKEKRSAQQKKDAENASPEKNGND